jgi:hypothetical protein
MGADEEVGRRLASKTPHPSSLAERSLRRQAPEVRAGCPNGAVSIHFGMRISNFVGLWTSNLRILGSDILKLTGSSSISVANVPTHATYARAEVLARLDHT